MAGGNFDRMRQMFAEQFQLNSQGYLYRKSSRGAPIQVTAAERDRYIVTYNRNTRIVAWGLGAAVIALLLSASFYSIAAGDQFSPVGIYLSVAAITALLVAAHFWSWNQPERELRSRGSTGQALSRAQVRRLFLEKVTYGQIGLAACAGIALLLEAPAGSDGLPGGHILPTVLSVILFIGCAITALRKWRLNSRP
jgi:hypothetical protein